MINILIFTGMCLTAVLFLMLFMAHHMVKISQSVTALHVELNKSRIAHALESNAIMSAATKADEPILRPHTPEPSPLSTGFVSKESIDHNYERAKKLVMRGMPLDRELMLSCHMTEEELELLS